MSKQVKIGRRGVVAAAVGALAGVIVRPGVEPVAATSGSGTQGPLVMGSNPIFNPDGAANRPNVSSVMTTLQASPNFGNFVGNNNRSILQIDGRPAGSANIVGIEAFSRGDAAAVVATGHAGSSFSVGVQASGNFQGVAASGRFVGVAAQSGEGGAGEPNAALLGLGGAGGYGASLGGDLAPLALQAATTAGAPIARAHIMGELFVDVSGKLFYCTVGGTPGTWVELSNVGPALRTLPTPERFVDTRNGLGGVNGPVAAGTTNVFTMSGRSGASGNVALQVPDNALTLVGNLTVIGGPNILNGSFVTLWPGGAQPTVSNINVGPGGVVANSFLVGTSGVGGRRAISVFNSQECDYILDISAFYT